MHLFRTGPDLSAFVHDRLVWFLPLKR